MRDNLKTVLGVLGGVFLALLLFATLASGRMMGGMGEMAGGGMMDGGMSGALFMLLFWGLVVALVAGLAALVLRSLR